MIVRVPSSFRITVVNANIITLEPLGMLQNLTEVVPAMLSGHGC